MQGNIDKRIKKRQRKNEKVKFDVNVAGKESIKIPSSQITRRDRNEERKERTWGGWNILQLDEMLENAKEENKKVFTYFTPEGIILKYKNRKGGRNKKEMRLLNTNRYLEKWESIRTGKCGREFKQGRQTTEKLILWGRNSKQEKRRKRINYLTSVPLRNCNMENGRKERSQNHFQSQ